MDLFTVILVIISKMIGFLLIAFGAYLVIFQIYLHHELYYNYNSHVSSDVVLRDDIFTIMVLLAGHVTSKWISSDIFK